MPLRHCGAPWGSARQPQGLAFGSAGSLQAARAFQHQGISSRRALPQRVAVELTCGNLQCIPSLLAHHSLNS